jgi:hypothetical protein
VLDPTLIDAIDVTAGLKPGGGILINSDPPGGLPVAAGAFRVATVDASAVAAAHGIGSRTQPIVNTAILGAFARGRVWYPWRRYARRSWRRVPVRGERTWRRRERRQRR